MTLLPKPYADEIVGSIILRGRIHLGLALKPFLRWVYGIENGRSTCSFVLEPALARVAAQCGLDPKELLERHTVFPYVSAFLPRHEAAALAGKLLNPRAGQIASTAALAQNVVSSSPFRRFCVECARDEKRRLGETHWHRTHQLPGTELCEVHGVPLIRTGIRMSVSSRVGELSMPPSSAARSTAVATTALPLPIAKTIAETNQRVLNNPLEAAVAWCDRYRTAARSAGFVHPSGELASGSLAGALQAHYGDKLLAELKCEMRTDGTRAWPALLLRPGNKEPTSVVRHVLLEAFLKSCNEDQAAKPKLQRKTYTKRDYAAIDKIAATRLRQTIREAVKTNERLTVQDLLVSAGVFSAYVHGRERFPFCREVIGEFKKSAQAERQLGGREFWRQRAPSKWGLLSVRSLTKADRAHPEDATDTTDKVE